MSDTISLRIKKIQKILRVNQSGVFDLSTVNALEKASGSLVTDLSLTEKKKNIQKMLGFKGNWVDGDFGVLTLTQIELFLNPSLPPLPAGASLVISRKSLQFILDSEISSKTTYNRLYKFPTLPPKDSGITIGIGYDLGYATLEKFTSVWKPHLSTANFNKLKAVIGKTGLSAKKALEAVQKIEIPYEVAISVFLKISAPNYAKNAKKIWPGIELLPPDVQGALLSVVYSRGWSVDGDNRKEMRDIAGFIPSKNLEKIAEAIRSMKRLWEKDSNLKGLIIRREKEAEMVENANYFMKPQDFVFV